MSASTNKATSPDFPPPVTQDGVKILGEKLSAFFAGIDKPRILEAGCGSGSVIKIPANAHVTGIDISQEELDKNTVVHDKIVGDLQTHELPRDAFDLVVCWDVLEHLERPRLAMDNMATAVRPGGVLLLAFPNVRSLKAVVAKHTPLGFHKALNRWIYGERAGSPGYLNFPTVLDSSIAPDRMYDFARSRELEIEFSALQQSGVQRRFFKKVGMGENGIHAFDKLVGIASFGNISVRESDCIFLFRRV
ncbi:MAG: class I SAM-dependent methyltransferase [Verrucomicrobiota bacterium]